MANYKAMAERARKSAAAAKADGAQMLGLVGGAGLIGLMVKSGAMDRLPDIGVPKTLITCGLAKAVGYNVSGTPGRIADGIGNAAAVVAIFQFTTGAAVSGAQLSGGNRDLDRERQLAAKLARGVQQRIGSGDDDGLEGEVAAMEELAELVAGNG